MRIYLKNNTAQLIPSRSDFGRASPNKKKKNNNNNNNNKNTKISSDIGSVSHPKSMGKQVEEHGQIA